MANFINKCCMCPADPLTSRSSISVPLLRPPYSLRHNNIEIRPISNPTMVYKHSSERKSHTSLTLNQKLDMTKLREEGKSQDGPKVRHHAPAS